MKLQSDYILRGAGLGAATWAISANIAHLYFFAEVFGSPPHGLSDDTLLAMIMGTVVGTVGLYSQRYQFSLRVRNPRLKPLGFRHFVG